MLRHVLCLVSVAVFGPFLQKHPRAGGWPGHETRRCQRIVRGLLPDGISYANAKCEGRCVLNLGYGSALLVDVDVDVDVVGWMM